MKYITRNECPPIPDRRYDWVAITDDYEPGDPIGYGRTEREALNDLLDRLEEEYSHYRECVEPNY